jgi:hypothetical protein
VHIEVLTDSSRGTAKVDYWATLTQEVSEPLFLGSGTVMVTSAEHSRPQFGEYTSAARPALRNAIRYDCPTADYGSHAARSRRAGPGVRRPRPVGRAGLRGHHGLGGGRPARSALGTHPPPSVGSAVPPGTEIFKFQPARHGCER